MMTQNHMLEKVPQFDRELGKRAEFFRKHPDPNRYVADELALRRVAKATIIAQFVNLSDIVKDNTRNEQVQIDSAVVPRYQPGEFQQRKHMLEQSAPKRMVHRFGRWCDAVPDGNVRVIQKRIDQFPDRLVVN